MLPVTVSWYSCTDDDDIMDVIEMGDSDGEDSDVGEGGEEGEGDTSKAKVENDQVNFLRVFLVEILFCESWSFCSFHFCDQDDNRTPSTSQLQGSNHSQGVHRVQQTLFLTFVPIGLPPRTTTGGRGRVGPW